MAMLLTASACVVLGYFIGAAHSQLNTSHGLTIQPRVAVEATFPKPYNVQSLHTSQLQQYMYTAAQAEPSVNQPKSSTLAQTAIHLLVWPLAATGFLVAIAGMLYKNRQSSEARTSPFTVISVEPEEYVMEVAVMAISGRKVAILGASGGIGQPMSLLLKDYDLIGDLALYGTGNRVFGVSVDLSHCNTPTRVSSYQGTEELGAALKDSDVVVITAGVPRKPGMTRDDLFNTNASIMQSLVEACAIHCPKAVIAIIANPVNSLVPVAAEVLKKAGVYDPRKVIGVTSLDVMRASTWVGEALGGNPRQQHIIVIGGHAGTTILPLLSQVKGLNYTEDQIKALTNRIQFGGDEVVKAKDGGGSATLSMAYCGANFVRRLLRAMNGEKGIVECCYTANRLTEAEYFAAPATLGPHGAEAVHRFGPLSAYEEESLAAMLPDLKKQIQKGANFITSQ